MACPRCAQLEPGTGNSDPGRHAQPRLEIQARNGSSQAIGITQATIATAGDLLHTPWEPKLKRRRRKKESGTPTPNPPVQQPREKVLTRDGPLKLTRGSLARKWLGELHFPQGHAAYNSQNPTQQLRLNYYGCRDLLTYTSQNALRLL